MAKDPLRTKFCEMMGIEFPIIAFTHCKDVVAAVVNAGGFAVLGEAMHTPEHIEDDIKWIRSRVGDKPFGIDLVLPSSAPSTDTLEQLLAKIPDEHRAYAQMIKEKYDVPPPKSAQDLHKWGGLNQELGRIHFRLGNHEAATEWARRALALGQRLGAPDVISHAYNTLGVAMARAGDLEEAAAYVRRSLDTALEHQLGAVACRAYSNLAVMYAALDHVHTVRAGGEERQVHRARVAVGVDDPGDALEHRIGTVQRR